MIESKKKVLILENRKQELIDKLENESSVDKQEISDSTEGISNSIKVENFLLQAFYMNIIMCGSYITQPKVKRTLAFFQ